MSDSDSDGDLIVTYTGDEPATAPERVWVLILTFNFTDLGLEQETRELQTSFDQLGFDTES